MTEVFGREAELDALRRFVDAVPGGPCALVLEGEAGVGKSTLWSVGVALARQRSLQVLVCRSAESEAKLSYTGLLDLLARLPMRRSMRFRTSNGTLSTSRSSGRIRKAPPLTSGPCRPLRWVCSGGSLVSVPSSWRSTTHSGWTPPRPAFWSSRFVAWRTRRSAFLPPSGSGKGRASPSS